jgi:hypothetical protein
VRAGAPALAIGVVVLASSAGCGQRGGPPVGREAAMPRGCLRAVAAVLDRDRPGAVTAAPAGGSPGVAGCRYVAPSGVVAVVAVDSNPQAEVRFERAVVERDQVSLGTSQPEDAPLLVEGVGIGADWFPGDRLMLSTDGRRLVSVQVTRGRRPQAVARAVTLAILAARG